jgi:hypothetical protein
MKKVSFKTIKIYASITQVQEINRTRETIARTSRAKRHSQLEYSCMYSYTGIEACKLLKTVKYREA